MSEAGAARQRAFLLLDGLRGFAALFVVSIHSRPLWGAGALHAYLAVDLFFILSGFVIAHAYERKLDSGAMTFGDFVKVRLVRLYPMYALAMLCALVLRVEHFRATDGLRAIGLSWLLAAFFLPSMLGRGVSLYPLIPATWSLFFELLVNFAYARWLSWLTSRRLAAVVGVAAVALIPLALSDGGFEAGGFWRWSSVPWGLARSVFGIGIGVLMHRHREALWARLPNGIPWWLPLIPLGLVLALSADHARSVDAAVDLGATLVFFPLLVIWAARQQVGQEARLLMLLGSASYPVYVLHIPAMELVQRVAGASAAAMAPWSGVLFVLVVAALGIWLEQRVDEPFRQWLTRRLFVPKVA